MTAGSMTIRRSVAVLAVGFLLTASGLLVQSQSTSAAPTATSAGTFRGTFKIGPGSYFRMRFPSGRGYFKNPDSRARNKTFTPLSGGSRGGLVVGTYQGQPRRAFDSRGGSRAGSIIRPQGFAGIRFGLATFSRSPGSNRRLPRPSLRLVGSRIYGQTSALTAAWNRLYFNQGSSAVRGSYNRRTHVYTIGWSSRIHGGPFNGFIGSWRLHGRFSGR